MEHKHQKTKTLHVKYNGRSSDFVTPNFILGCEGGCSYCYVERWNRPKIYFNDNVDEILNKIKEHSSMIGEKKPNQVDGVYWTYDVGCNTDLTLYWNRYPFKKVLKFFRDNGIKSTFATKFFNPKMLREAEANQQNRIRFSLVPESIRQITQPKTSSLAHMLMGINMAKDNGWDVHINFSPIIYTDDWLKDYERLFKLVDSTVKNKDGVFCECIFLTHHEGLHKRNLENRPEAEKLLWTPGIQELKTSIYGGKNLRYQWNLKADMINQFKDLHSKIIPWCKIRYIF